MDTYSEWLTLTQLSEDFYALGDALRDDGEYIAALSHYYAADLMSRVAEVYVLGC